MKFHLNLLRAVNNAIYQIFEEHKYADKVLDLSENAYLKANASDLIGGVNIKGTDSQLARVLLDLSTTAQINDSLKLGDAVLGKLGKVNRLHKPRVEQAGFAVLRAPDIPSILVETAFISNPDEERKLSSPDHQQELAEAIAKGIASYFAKNPPVARTPLA